MELSKYPWQQRQNERREQRRPKPKPRSPIVKKQYIIAKQSEKEKARRARYNPQAKLFKEQYPFCQCNRNSCKRKTTDVHHLEGTDGDLLFDQSKWIGVNRLCHRWIHDHPEEAMALGLLLSRLAGD